MQYLMTDENIYVIILFSSKSGKYLRQQFILNSIQLFHLCTNQQCFHGTISMMKQKIGGTTITLYYLLALLSIRYTSFR